MDELIDPNIGRETLKLFDRSIFNIGAIGFDVDGDEDVELVQLIDLIMVDLQASFLTNGDVWGPVVIVGGGGDNADVDGYENGEWWCDVVGWLLIIGFRGGIGGLIFLLEYNGGGKAVFVKSNVITGGVSHCVNGVL